MVITSADIEERVGLAITTGGGPGDGGVQTLREQMDLPLWFTARVAREDFELHGARSHLPVGAIEAHHESLRSGTVPAGSQRSDPGAGHLECVCDLTVREPSLEDMFFGFSD